MSSKDSPPESGTPSVLPGISRESLLQTFVESIGDYAIFFLDPSGTVMSWNTGAERIKGYKAQEIIGRHFSTFYTQESRDRNWPAIELTEAARIGRFEDEGWRVRADGTRFWANVIITALKDQNGVLRGFSKITRDLSERREHEERLRRSEERFRLLVDGVQDYAIYMLDTDGKITSWNTGAQRITGYSADEVIGRRFELFHRPDELRAGEPDEELRTALMYRRSHKSGWRLRKDGTPLWADVVTTPLRDPQGELRGYAQVMRDLSERKRMEELEEQGRRVNEFLAMLAHELRNPLAPIRNALGILAVSREASPQVAWCREVIERQTTTLTRLVDDLLDMSRITRGKMQINGVPMDLNAAVERALEAARPFIESRRHRLDLRLPPEATPVTGDMTRLTQVFLNLINNAAKYTREGGRIEIEVECNPEDCIVRVTDNGLGIPPDLLERVFDLFAQGERTLDRSEGGLGIGLTLAKRIVILHGGMIRGESEGVGKGSTFTVVLPRLRLDMKPDVPLASTALPPSARRRSILVVDDNVDAASSIAMFLRMLGHDVDIENDGPSALDRIAAAPPEIVFLDIGLPGLDGYEVARRVRERPEGQGIRLYAMTGYGQESDKKRALASGFDAHLVKPVPPAELLQLIEAERA